MRGHSRFVIQLVTAGEDYVRKKWTSENQVGAYLSIDGRPMNANASIDTGGEAALFGPDQQITRVDKGLLLFHFAQRNNGILVDESLIPPDGMPAVIRQPERR